VGQINETIFQIVIQAPNLACILLLGRFFIKRYIFLESASKRSAVQGEPNLAEPLSTPSIDGPEAVSFRVVRPSECVRRAEALSTGLPLTSSCL